MEHIHSGKCVAKATDSPGDSRVAYTLTCTPGLSVNWMRSWFKALSRTWESYEEEWQSRGRLLAVTAQQYHSHQYFNCSHFIQQAEL